jgi:hypothetical protein
MLRDHQGRAHCLSTCQTDKATALILARHWQAIAKQKRTQAQNQKVIAYLHVLIGGETLIQQFGVPEIPETSKGIRGEEKELRIFERRNKRLELLRDELEHRQLNGKLSRRFWEIVRGIGCTSCGFCQWPSILPFHHIDGDRSNNSLSNLTILCPNCHRALHQKVVAISYQSFGDLLGMADSNKMDEKRALQWLTFSQAEIYCSLPSYILRSLLDKRLFRRSGSKVNRDSIDSVLLEACITGQPISGGTKKRKN